MFNEQKYSQGGTLSPAANRYDNMDSPTEDDEPIDLTLARKITFKKQVNQPEYVGANLVLNRKSLN